MKCIIQKINIHNFKSFADQSFDFSARHGISTIIGVNNDIPGAANAAGKSSLFSALFFVLFGKDGVKTKNKFLKNRYVDSNEFYVQLYLTIDGKHFKIDRGSIGAASYLRLFDVDNNGNENEITKASILETECFLKHMLSNLTADIFLKTVLLSPALGQNFFMLSSKEKAEFLNLLSGTNRIYSINEMVNKDINNLNTSIKILDNNLMALSKQIDTLKQKKAAFIADQEQMKKEHDAQIEKHNAIIAENLEQLKIHSRDYENLKSLTEPLNKEYDELHDKLEKLKMKMVASATHVKSLMGKNDQLNAFIQKHVELLNRLCVDCKQNIGDFLNINNIKKSINENLEIIKNEKKELIKMQAELNNSSEILEEARLAKEEHVKLLNNEFAVFTKISKTIESEKELVKTIENNAASANMTEPFSEMIANTEKDLKTKRDEKDDNTKERQKLAILKFMTSDDIIHKFVISQFARDINCYMSQYLNIMGVGYSIVFNNDLSYTFMTPAGEVSYDTFSSGEKMRLNIAISFTFRKLLFKYLNIDVNVLILDEYVDSALDKLAIGGIINLLNEICSDSPLTNIYVVSHRNEIVMEINGSKIIVQKTNGISKIIEENS